MATVLPAGKDTDAVRGQRPRFYHSTANLTTGATHKTPLLPVDAGVADTWYATGALQAVLVQGMIAGIGSAANGVKIEQSIDGVTAHLTTQVRGLTNRSTTISDGEQWSQAVRITMPFWRYTFTNGAGTSTTLVSSVIGITIEEFRDIRHTDLAYAHTAPTAAVTSGAALAANVARKFAMIINDSDTTVYLKVGAAAVLNEGIRINANGGSYTMSEAEGNLDTRAINSIHGGAGTKVLLVTEGVS